MSKRRIVLHGGSWQIPLGRLLMIIALAIAVISTGLLAYFVQDEFWRGVWTVLATLAGVFLGALLNKVREPVLPTERALAAGQRLARCADRVHATTTQLNQQAGERLSVRTRRALDTATSTLVDVRKELYVAVSDWRVVDPDIVERIDDEQQQGSRALARLSREGRESGTGS